MTYIILALALVGILMAWQSNRKHKALNERISQLNGRIYQTRREMLEAQEKTKRELNKLKFDILKAQGNLKVTADMTIDEIMMIHPMAEQVLAGFHIGGCSSCAVDGAQRLDLALAPSGQPIEPILVALHALVTENQASPLAEKMLKTSNVQLTI